MEICVEIVRLRGGDIYLNGCKDIYIYIVRYVCMYVYKGVYIYIYIYMYIHIYIYIYIYIHSTDRS